MRIKIIRQIIIETICITEMQINPTFRTSKLIRYIIKISKITKIHILNERDKQLKVSLTDKCFLISEYFFNMEQYRKNYHYVIALSIFILFLLLQFLKQVLIISSQKICLSSSYIQLIYITFTKYKNRRKMNINKKVIALAILSLVIILSKMYLSTFVLSKRSLSFNQTEQDFFKLLLIIIIEEIIIISLNESYLITQKCFPAAQTTGEVATNEQFAQFKRLASTNSVIGDDLKTKIRNRYWSYILKFHSKLNNHNSQMNTMCYCLGNIIMVVCIVIYVKPNQFHNFFFAFVGLAAINNIIQIVIQGFKSINLLKLLLWYFSLLMIVVFSVMKASNTKV